MGHDALSLAVLYRSRAATMIQEWLKLDCRYLGFSHLPVVERIAGETNIQTRLPPFQKRDVKATKIIIDGS